MSFSAVVSGETFCVYSSINDCARFMVLRLCCANFHHEEDSKDGEGDDQDEEENDDPNLDLFLLVGFLYPAILLLLIDHHGLSRSGSADGVLGVDESLGVNAVVVCHFRHRNLLRGSEFLVENLEGGEGVEHLRAIGSRGFSGEGVVRQVVLGSSFLIGWESTLLILVKGSSASSMGEDTLSAVTGRVELSGLGEKIHTLTVVMTIVVRVTLGVADTVFADGRVTDERLLNHLLVDHVQGVDGIIRSVGSGSWALRWSVNIHGVEVGFRASAGEVNEV